MLKISLRDFLATGSLDVLSLGQTRDAVWNLFDEPPLWGGNTVSGWFESRAKFGSAYYWRFERRTSWFHARWIWLKWRFNWRFSPAFRKHLINHAFFWNYGNLEIAFHAETPDATVSFIKLLFQGSSYNPILFEEDITDIAASRENFELFLSKMRLVYWQDKQFEHWLIIENKTRAYFDDDDHLHSIFAILH
jgi:hypothetical protein